MLTIITGTPGAGKTLYSLDRILKEYRGDPNSDKWRPIYINGVPDLDYEFFGADHLEDPEKWYECPEGSVIFIDEGQRIFPQRPPSAAVPQKCREFETHRHRGFDVIVTTQDANTLDVHLRRLAGRHFHIKRTLGQELAAVLEYDHYQKDPTDHFNKREAISTASWKYNKKLYERYKSAEVHTVKKRYPFKLFLIPLAVLVIVGLIWFAFREMQSQLGTIQGEEVGEGIDQVTQGSFPGKSSSVDLEVDPFQLHKPRIPGLLHTAPFYDEVFQAEVFPVPYCIIYQLADGMRFDSGCLCQTQQGTRYQTDDATCRYWARNGFFDPTVPNPDPERERETYTEVGSLSRHSARLE